MVLASACTVRRWTETGDEILLYGHSECGERKKAIRFQSPALLFEFRQWINECNKLGGNHANGPFSNIQDYILKRYPVQ